MSIYKQFDITDKIPLLLQQLAKTRVLHVTIFNFCQIPNFTKQKCSKQKAVFKDIKEDLGKHTYLRTSYLF